MPSRRAEVINPLCSNTREHRGVIGQDLGDEFLDAGVAGDRDDMVHQDRAETVALIVVDDRESHLGLAGLGDDETDAADDSGEWPFDFATAIRTT